MTEYESFLQTKKKQHKPSGIEVKKLHSSLFPFQQFTTDWALRTGRACIFAGTGLGKTRMQIEYNRHLPGVKLILAPLAVNGQTVLEAKEVFGVDIRQAEKHGDIKGDGIYITNYDRLHLFDDVKVDAVTLDESSIIKSHDGAYRNYIQERFKDVPYKLCLTATPSPNDYMELGTHAEFMGAMTRAEMLATYFTHDGGETSKWRLKGHSKRDFWEWVQSWAMMFVHPRDIGFEQEGYDLPELIVTNHEVEVENDTYDLFGAEKVNATNLHRILRESSDVRALKCLELIGENPEEPWLVWCNTNDEQRDVTKLVNGMVSVDGSDTRQNKEDRLLGFASGKYNRLVTKAKIAGFGLNWQRCNQMIFCGVNYSFEQQYQAIRRCWRFGQTRPVHVHYVTCSAQESVLSAVRFKEQNAKTMVEEMRNYTK